MSKARRIRKISVFTSGGKFPVLTLVMGDTIEKVSKSSILTKVSILSILAKSIGNSIPLEPAMFLVSIAEQSLNTS